MNQHVDHSGIVRSIPPGPGILPQNVYFDVAMPTSDAVSAKVGKIERKYFCDAQRFRCNHDRRIGEIHRVISILFHQLEGSCCCCVVHTP